MRTDRVLVAGVVLLGVLVIGSTAASYDAAESVSVDDGGEAGGSGNGDGSGLPAAGQGGANGAFPLPAWVVENFVLLTFGVGTLLFVLGSVVITWLHGVEGLKRVLSLLGETALSGILYLVVVAFLVWLVFGFTGEGIDLMDASSAESTGGPGGGSGGGEAAGTDGRSIPYWYVLIAFWALLGVGWFYLFRRDGGDEGTSATGSTVEEMNDESVATSARLPQQETMSDVPPSNPVYRAWREMASEAERETDGTLTANEVADAADERGLDRDAVRTLTGLFEEVRYGDRPVTDDRERRAKSALESIDGSGGRGA